MFSTPQPGSRGPVSRLQMANMREEAAARRVAAAQQEVAQQEAVLARLGAERSEALVTVRGVGARQRGAGRT